MDTNAGPRLAIVATSRNDDHGGNLRKRMRLCFNGILTLAERHRLPCELIVVEWNPPVDRPKLAEIIPWPESNPYCTVRIIEVPNEIHRRYKHADALPLYQMIAKNVGIRRARAPWVLATNIDILFTDALFAFLASGELVSNHMYRCDRHDTDGDIPEDADIDTQLRIAHETTLRLCNRIGTWNLRTGDVQPVNASLAVRGAQAATHYPLHTSACGDFTLMSRDDWFELKGYWELDVYSFHLDSLLCYSAVYAGIQEEILTGPMWVHHIEHTAGWTPEIAKAGTLDRRLQSGGVPRISDNELERYCREMSRLSRPLSGPNDEHWGLASEELFEQVIVRAACDGAPAESDRGILSPPFPAVRYRYAKSGLSPETCEADPYMSIVVVARGQEDTDSAWTRELAARCGAMGLSAEIVVVEWAPSNGRATTTEAAVPVRTIEIPHDEHARLAAYGQAGLLETIARNVGARRARGVFLLFVEPGAAPSDALLSFLAFRRLDPDCFYRLDGNEAAAPHVTADPLAPLRTDGCRDFLIVSRDRFASLLGFPEVPRFARRAEELFLCMAHAEGMTQALLHPPLTLAGRESEADTSNLAADEERDCLWWREMMMRNRAAVTPNRDDWGLGAAASLPPVETAAAPKIDTHQALIDRFAERLGELYFREQTAANLRALASLAGRLRPTTVVEIGVGHGLSLRAWLAEPAIAEIVAVDEDFGRLRRGIDIDPVDLAKVRRVESAISEIDPEALWPIGTAPLVLVNSGLLGDVNLREVWTRLIPTLPPGSTVVVSGVWLSPTRLDDKTAYPFVAGSVIADLDPLRCCEIGYAEMHRGGSILARGNIGPMADWLNANPVAVDVPSHTNIVVFEVPADVAAPDAARASPVGFYRYNPAATWQWIEGSSLDPSIRQIIRCCETGERAYFDDDIATAAEQFTHALVLYERLTRSAYDEARKMDAADLAGDRDSALRHHREWRRMIDDIGRLRGAKRILVCCELRLGNLRRAFDVPTLAMFDFIEPVEPALLDDIWKRLLRTDPAYTIRPPAPAGINGFLTESGL